MNKALKTVAGGRTARDSRSDRQVLYGARSDRPARPNRSKYLISSSSFSPLHLHTHENTSPPFLSQGEKDPPCGEALPFDPGPSEGIPGLTATSSTISSGYFIDSSPFYPWISFVRVQCVKHEDSILGHGFVGLMVGIEL
jgi:hypothetical protein